MKRLIPFLLALLLFAAPSCAEGLHWLSPTIGGSDAVMIVDNGKDWSVRLNLRAEPRKGSEIKGRIYTGTRVELYEDNGEWCLVGLNFGGGSVYTGYVMKQYLTPVGNAFSALCPLAVAKRETELLSRADSLVTQLHPGDTAYVMAACGEEYFLLMPGAGQGFALADAFEPLKEPDEGARIRYESFTVPSGGLSFTDEYTGAQVELSGGVVLEDCWQLPGEDVWHVTFGAGIQRTPRVQGTVPAEKLTQKGWMPFEGEVYALEQSFIARVGTVDGQPILRRTDQNGDVFWALGDVPGGAERIDSEICRIEREPRVLLSQAVMDNIFDYVVRHSVLDERTEGEGTKQVTKELAERCTLHAALELDPGSGELLRIHAWLEDVDGTYVTGGDLDPRSGAITRWGCNA